MRLKKVCINDQLTSLNYLLIIFKCKGWWKGVTTKGITGVFPSNFVVEVTSDSPQISKKDSPDKSDSDSIDGPKSLETNLNDGLEKKPKPITKVGFGDIFAGGIKPKLTPIGDTTKNVPKKPPPPTPASDNNDPAPKLPPKPVREQAKVLFAYEAQNEDELTIKEGDIITIVSKDIEDVGWWKGELNGRIALFPDNFVEIIKPSDEQTSKAVKKPERPTEKPPPIANPSANANSPKLTNLSKSESIKSSNKSFEELPKTSVTSNNSSVSSSGVGSAPIIPGKKPKVLGSSIFQSKPKQEPPQTSQPSSVRPDVVPQENGSKLDKEETNNRTNVTNNSSENQFMDSTSNKLTHLTANRVKGPSSRRPPSTIFIPKESDPKENGDVAPNKTETNSNHSTDTKPNQAQTPPEKGPTAPPTEKLPPWMVELRKAQEKRKENPEEQPKATLPSPTKTSPNRFSGDFSNKSLQHTSINADEDKNDSISSIHVFKPLKSTKPNVTTTPVAAQPPVTETQTTIASVTATNTSSKTTNIVISSATTTTPSPKVEDSVAKVSTDKKSDVLELEKEIRALKESTVSRKDFDALVKQVLLSFCFVSLHSKSHFKRSSVKHFYIISL